MRKGLLVLALLLCFGLFPAYAQDEDSPLLQMLARIPDGVAAREWLTYIDYHALIAARPGAPRIESWDEFEASQELPAGGLYMSALLGIQSGPQFFNRYFMLAAEMPDIVGFELFAVERAVEYGSPPGQVVLLEGDFDADQVISTHEARDYTQNSAGDLTLLCPPNGCDTGNQQNLRERNPANPFGGDLGRSQPVLLGDQLIASSTDDEALNMVASVIDGDSDSLADQADYRAAAEAISASGTVLQAYFISPLDIASASEALIAARLPEEQLEAIMQQFESEFEPVPQYNLVALAHTASEDEQQALVVLVYGSTGDAKTAAAVIPARLDEYISLAVNQPFMDILTNRGVTSVEATVQASSSERATVVISLHSPLPETEPPEGETRLRTIGLAYAALVQAYIRRDLGWLATQF